jgi:hypothetical protein
VVIGRRRGKANFSRHGGSRHVDNAYITNVSIVYINGRVSIQRAAISPLIGDNPRREKRETAPIVEHRSRPGHA